jgi:hypothetical protein
VEFLISLPIPELFAKVCNGSIFFDIRLLIRSIITLVITRRLKENACEQITNFKRIIYLTHNGTMVLQTVGDKETVLTI